MRRWMSETAGGLPAQFWLLWTNTLINCLGAFVVLFLALYLTTQRDLSQSQAGLTLGLFGVGGALGTTAAGVLADRWGRRPTMLTGQFGAAALMLLLGFARTYPQIVVVAFLLGAFAAAVRPSAAAMMIDVVPAADRSRAYSLNYWAVNIGFAIAPIGAGLAARTNYLLLFVIDAGTTLITAVITLFLLRETKPQPVVPVPRGGGLGRVVRDRVFMTYLLITLVPVVVMLQHQSTMPIAMTAGGLSPATYGWVIAVNGLLVVGGQLFVPRLIKDVDRSRVLVLATVLIGVGFGLLVLAHSAWFYAFTVVIWTIGEMLQATVYGATVAALSPAESRGRYQGVSSLSWSAGTFLAPVLGGLAQQHFGSRILWLGCLAVCVLAAVAHLAAGPMRERRIAALADPPAPATEAVA
ncbi:MDR family MFS transporter [Actinoplanes sp. CA-054009]